MLAIFVLALLFIAIGACVSPVFYFAAGAAVLVQLFSKDKF